MNESINVDLVALEFSMMENLDDQSVGTKVEYIAKVNLIESIEGQLRGTGHDDEAA
jgi:hypothetical protein